MTRGRLRAVAPLLGRWTAFRTVSGGVLSLMIAASRHADRATLLERPITPETIADMARPGPKRGVPQRQWLSPDPQDEDERVAVYAQVASRARVRGRRAAAAAHLSFAAYVEALLLRDEIDEDGCPVWAADRPSMKGSAPASAPNVSEMLAANPRYIVTGGGR